MKNVLIPALLLISITACKRDADELPQERQFTRDFYVQGEWRDTLPSSFQAFDFTVGRKVNASTSNIFICQSNSGISVNNQKTIQSSLIGQHSDLHFFIRFQSGTTLQPGGSPAWTTAELDTFFIPGREFQIGGSSDNVEIGIDLSGALFSYEMSSSASAPAPEGRVTIVAADEYEYMRVTGSGVPTIHRGKKVKLTFQTKLGRLAQLNGTWQVVGEAEIRDGEAALFFEY